MKHLAKGHIASKRQSQFSKHSNLKPRGNACAQCPIAHATYEYSISDSSKWCLDISVMMGLPGHRSKC